MLGITGILVEEDVDHDAPTVNFKQLHRLNGPPRTGRLKLCLVAKWKTALVAPNPRISTNERTCSQAASQCRAPRTQTLKRAWGSCVSLHEASRGADIVGPCSILRAVAGRSRSEKSVPALALPQEKLEGLNFCLQLKERIPPTRGSPAKDTQTKQTCTNASTTLGPSHRTANLAIQQSHSKPFRAGAIDQIGSRRQAVLQTSAYSAV